MTKLCCSDCFENQSVKDYIINNGVGKNYCDFCDDHKKHCIEPKELTELFSPLVNLYTRIEEFMPMEIMKEHEGQNIAEKLIEDWNPFTNDIPDNVESLLSEIFEPYDIYEDEGLDLDCWVENSDMFWGAEDEPSNILETSWKEFCKELISENRFFPKKSLDLSFLSEIPILTETIKTGSYLFRARKSEKPIKIPPRKMGMPPTHLTQPGRANPKGIPYLYLASDKSTAIHEVRPETTEFVTIGKFKIIKELRILNLSNPYIYDPFLCGESLFRVITLMSFFRMLGNELSKPIKPKQKDLHYIPTQYLCEFIKHEGYDGVAYKSHVGSGQNIALFNNEKVKCTRSNIYSIKAEAIEI